MMMPFATTNEGFSAFVAIGLKWPGSAVGREDARRGHSGNEEIAQPVISVGVPAGGSDDSSLVPPRFQEPTIRENDPLLRAYAMPTGQCKAPRLLYCKSLPGQMIDIYA